MKYTNRNGKTYYLYAGKTKSGKPRYFCSSKESTDKGTPVNKVPEGYEIYELPENAQVFLRKKRPRLITDTEEQFVKKSLDGLHRSGQYIVDCKDEYLTIYESERAGIKDFEEDTGNVEDQIRNILGKLKIEINPDVSLADEIPRTILCQGHYTAVLRFFLSGKETRTFTVERYCFRGFIDDWIYIGGPDKFQSIVKKHINYLGTDQFYELPYL